MRIESFQLSTIRQILRTHPIFGPVSSAILPTSLPNFTSFGMKSLFVRNAIAGCLNSSKFSHADSPSTNSGLHAGSPSAMDALAKLNKQSSSANTRTARNHTPRSLSNSSKSLNLKLLTIALRVSRASFKLRIVLAREGTTQRCAAYHIISGEILYSNEPTGLSTPTFNPVSGNIFLAGLRLN